MKAPLGIVLYKGKSQLDGEKILVIATGFQERSENRKTGDMIQTWIIRRDIDPILAKRLGKDFSICGDCFHRDAGTCYVNLCHGPLAVYNSFHNDNYVDFNEDMLHLFEGRNIRLGSYGDPAAVPIHIWTQICNVAAGWTGYTHQWNNTKLPHINVLQKYCMASCDMIEEQRKAISLGWRTFRIRTGNIDNFVEKNEFVCPASKEGGERSNCAKCQGCNGLQRPTMNNVVIKLHGKGIEDETIKSKFGDWQINRFEKTIKARRYKKKWRKDWKAVVKAFKLVTKC
tara:strand:+ start:20482 stop:21336 length:855 start_codon:yes stop_codon:yes gene_type:complete